MQSRRDFLASTSAVAGLIFVGCDIAGTPAAKAQPRRREVVVNGTRVKTVNVHAHCAVPEALALMNLKLAGPQLRPDLDAQGDSLALRLKTMDEQGLDVEALSINPNWYKLDRDVAAQVIKIQNERLAEVCAKHPDRLVAFATVALQHPDLAVEQLQAAVKNYGFRGVNMGGNVAGAEISDPKFNPFWAKAEELGVLVFIHPQGDGAPRELAQRFKGNGYLSNVIGNPLETTIALSHLIFEGTLDRFPGLKICAAHGGGFLPSYANRSDAVIRCFPNRVGPLPKKNPTAYLKDGQLFFDTIVFTPEALRHLIAETGPGQIMIGTDYPFPWTSTEVDLVLNTPGLNDDQRIAILGGTAAKLLGIK